MRERSVTVAAGMVFGILALPGAVPAQAPREGRPASPGPCDFHIGQPFAVPAGLPVEVRHVERTLGGLVARIINVSTQPIVAYEARVSTVCGDAGGPRHLLAMSRASGLDWRPGTEALVRFSADVIPEDASVDMMGVVLASGVGYGDPKVVNRFLEDARDHLDGRVGVLAVLEGAPVPATEDELQALIDQVALAMARVPISGPSTSVLSPYVETVAALKRLQGRGMASTERLDRELQAIRARWQRELHIAQSSPATRSPDR